MSRWHKHNLYGVIYRRNCVGLCNVYLHAIAVVAIAFGPIYHWGQLEKLTTTNSAAVYAPHR